MHICEICGSEHVQWVGRCPTCKEWNSVKPFKVRREGQSCSAIVTRNISRYAPSLPPPRAYRVTKYLLSPYVIDEESATSSSGHVWYGHDVPVHRATCFEYDTCLPRMRLIDSLANVTDFLVCVQCALLRYRSKPLLFHNCPPTC